MFSDAFLAGREASSQSQEQVQPPKAPLTTYEDWKLLEGVSEWPCSAPGEAQSNFDTNSVLGSLDRICQDLQTHSPWGAVFLDGVERKLGELENTLGSLADKFLCGTTTADTTAEGLTVTKDPAFLTELRDHGRLSARSPSRVRDSDSQECGTLDLRKLVYPGIRGGRGAVPLPGSLEPLHLLDLVTNTTPLPQQIAMSWNKVFMSRASSCLLQNTFWYVWLSYFKYKPDPEDLSHLFTLISENFMSLHQIMDHNHKDQIFVHLPGYLARAVYSGFCHAFPTSSKVFNSEEFLSYLTNLTSKWITGATSPLGSWKRWPRRLLDPHLNSESEDTERKPVLTRSPTFSERDVTRLSIRDKPCSVQLCTSSAGLLRRRRRRTRSSHTAQQSRVNTPTHTHQDECVGVGEGPTFECVQFGLMSRSPLLQNYLVRHGLEEEKREGGVWRRPGPVVGRTQISKLPPPSISYRQLLKNSVDTSKKNYDHFEKALARSEQEMNTARKKHNALLRASDRRTARLLQHKFEVAIMAETIMNNYASKLAPIKPVNTTENEEEETEQ